MVTRALALFTVLLLATSARADSPKLDQARKAIEEVRFDEAQRLLVGALADGGNSPAGMREIYKLSASTAVVLGQREVGEQNYRRWIALDASASLGANVAPKLREPFEAAQAYIAAHGRLTATVTRLSATEIDVAVTDPLSMAVAATVLGGTPVPLNTERRARVAPTDAGAVTLAVVDDRGNRLLELSAAAMPVPATTTGTTAPLTFPRRDVEQAEPEGKRSRLWLLFAVPSAVLFVTGASFVLGARNDNDTVAEQISNSTTHNFRDVDATHDRAVAFTALGSVAVGFAVAFAVPAVIFYLRARKSDRAVVPTVSSDSAGAALVGRF